MLDKQLHNQDYGLFLQLIERRTKHDWIRTARMTAMGGFVVAPIIRTWYLTLDRVCRLKLNNLCIFFL